MKIMVKVLFFGFILFSVIGCATQQMGVGYRPIVDTKGVNLNRYEADLQECQKYAHQTANAAQSAVAGAIVGAVFGTVLAAAAGSSYDRSASARVGGVSGAVGGGVQGETNQRTIIRRCLTGRGYSVLQ
jgi:outer membrane lipoprotein SlyB